MKIKNFITELHIKTKRNYLERMNNDKIKCMKIAKKYSKNYWDGDRKFGYGGYFYKKDYWKKTALKIIKTYNLRKNSSILDIGCGKGYLLFEIKKIVPSIKIYGIDISKYAIENSKLEVRKCLKIFDARKKLPYKKKFDLVISLGTMHNFSLIDLSKCLAEVNRISKKSYIMVESYRNEKELFNLQCWALTCQTFLNVKDCLWFFKKNKYKGDYEFIFFS